MSKLIPFTLDDLLHPGADRQRSRSADGCCDAPSGQSRARAAHRPGEIPVALVGRPNAGKSSLYNAVTGANARVGNFPGVTVDVLEGTVPLPQGGQARLFDLPGVYSLSPRLDEGSDEAQALACLSRLRQDGSPFVVLQVVDSTQLALHLRLTQDLVAQRVPLVVALTLSDVLARQGRRIDTQALSEALGAPVISVSALSVRSARTRILEAVEEVALAGYPKTDGRELDVTALAKRVETDAAGERERSRRAFTARVDRVLLHPVAGPVIFVALMATLFAAVFLVADPASDAMARLTSWLGSGIQSAIGRNWVSSLLSDGVLGGAGTVLAFLPQIVILTVAMELLEASGYLARGAFLVDRLLRFAGLGGRSFVPLLMGHACAVPAITAARVIRDPGERLRTVLVIPLMLCSARIPTYALLIAAFLSRESVWVQSAVFVGLYFAGGAAGLVASLVLGKTVKRTGTALPLVLELPAYRMPRRQVMWAATKRGARRFVVEVGTGILVASLCLWVLLKVPMPGSHLPPRATPTERIEASIASHVGHALQTVTKPAGFDWRIDVGLIGSFGARELMVSTMGIIFGLSSDKPAPIAEELRAAKGPGGLPAYSLATALALMAFFVLACQCLSTLAALWRETKSIKWPLFVVGYTYIAAFAAAVAVFQTAHAFGL